MAKKINFIDKYEQIPFEEGEELSLEAIEVMKAAIGILINEVITEKGN